MTHIFVYFVITNFVHLKLGTAVTFGIGNKTYIGFDF